MKPKIGSTIVTLGVVSSNGTDEVAAIVTRVWSKADPADGKPVMVNVTALPDMPYGAQPAFVPQGSINLYETRAEAKAEQDRVNAIGDNAANFRVRGLSGAMVAFWPDQG